MLNHCFVGRAEACSSFARGPYPVERPGMLVETRVSLTSGAIVGTQEYSKRRRGVGHYDFTWSSR